MDKSVILELVTGRVEPKIYAFLTSDVPRFLKVGDTYRPVPVRIAEWREKGFVIGDPEKKPRQGKDYESWDATLEQGVFFRDYEVHKYLTGVAGMEQITREKLENLPRNGESRHGAARPYSQEFYRYTADENPELSDVKAASVNVGLAIKDITDYYSGRAGHKLSYRIFDVRGRAEESKKEKITKKPRDNQEAAIKKFWTAVGDHPKRGTKLLMYAVMRFGKTFTSLCCAKKMNAKLVVVVSAKADVADEWCEEVKETANFSDYEFLDANALKRNHDLLKRLKKTKKPIVLFLTLQTFLKEKAWLEGLFRSKIDLLIVDETHFGARAAKLGRVLKGKDASKNDRKIDADVDVDDDVKEALKTADEQEIVSQISLNATVTMHLSGTPYRILMRGEFPDENIVAFCQYTDIIDAQRKWDIDYLGKQKEGTSEEYAEWENPYFGFPQMIRFAFNPSPQALKLMNDARDAGESSSLAEIFRPEIDDSGEFTGRFAHQNEVEEFLRVFNGSDEGEPTGFISLFKFLKENKRDICRHIVMVLPYCASCDAMAELLKSGKFKNLEEYEILNISGHKRDSVFEDPKEVKKRIRTLAAGTDKVPPRKTITLTVNRMLTGSTIPEWDTMVFLKNTSFPEEYDQAIFRLQSPYTQAIPSVDSEGKAIWIRKNLKPQTILIDFDPGRMFRMQERKGQVYVDNVGKKGKDELTARIRQELKVSPIIFANGDKLKQADETDVVNEIREYTGTRGISEEAQELDVDLDVLSKSDRLERVISQENTLDANGGLTMAASSSGTDDFDPLSKKTQNPPPTNGDTNSKDDEDDSDKKKASRFRNYYRRIMFYAFLIEERVCSLEDVINSIDRSKRENLRIATHLKICKYDLVELKKMRSQVLSQFEYAIDRISLLAHDPRKKDPVERALVAIRNFGRLGESEIVTPMKIAREMVTLIPDPEWRRMINDKERILDVAAKIGEFAIAIVQKLQRLGFDKKDYCNLILSIPTSPITYEFTLKVYKLLGLNPKCVAMSENLTSYKLLEVKKDGDKTLNYDRIRELLTQKKAFDTISINDTIPKKGKTMCVKVGAVISNPPYQDIKVNEGDRPNPLYHLTMNVAYAIADKAVFITPGRFLFNAGQTPKEWNTKMLADDHLRIARYVHKSKEVFPGNIEIKGGVVITYRDANLSFGSIGTFTPYRELNSIMRKVSRREGSRVRLDDIVSSQGVFRFSAVLYDDHPEAVNGVGAGTGHKIVSREFATLPGIFLEKRPTQGDYIAMTGRLGNDRVIRFVKRCYLEDTAYLDAYKVLVPEANGTGALGEALSTPVIGKPMTGFTDTFIAIGPFATRREATNCMKYIKTRFARAMLGTLKVTHHTSNNTWSNVPKQDFTSSSDIDWSRSVSEIDEQLYVKYGIIDKPGQTSAERDFIESMIKPME